MRNMFNANLEIVQQQIVPLVILQLNGELYIRVDDIWL